MKIGVISDTHIPERRKDLPKEILAAFKGVDMIVHAGDLVDTSVLSELGSVCKNIKAVCGNMDYQQVRKVLPEKLVFTVAGKKIGLMHGFGPPNKLVDSMAKAFESDKPDIVIFGHSHNAYNEKKGATLYFNPGSATDTIFALFRSYGIIEINKEIKATIVKI